MRLTTFTDYSLRVLIYLAVSDDGQPTIREIAQRYDISRNHLMKVVQELSQKGYLIASRGKRGGLRLGIPPAEIKIGMLVRDMESDFALAECLGDKCHCTESWLQAAIGFYRSAGRFLLRARYLHAPGYSFGAQARQAAENSQPGMIKPPLHNRVIETVT